MVETYQINGVDLVLFCSRQPFPAEGLRRITVLMRMGHGI
jgi:hypothetical protein